MMTASKKSDSTMHWRGKVDSALQKGKRRTHIHTNTHAYTTDSQHPKRAGNKISSIEK